MDEQARQSGGATGGRWPAGVQAALWLIAALLAVHAALLLRPADTAVWAQGAGGLGKDEAAGIFAVPGQITRDLWGVYVVDSRAGNIVLYQFNPNTHKLRLVAARSFIYDRCLTDYNTEPPTRGIAELLSQIRSGRSGLPEGEPPGGSGPATRPD